MITVLGEALIDLVPTADGTVLKAFPGGSALHIAVGAARLGYPTALVARLSRDSFGQILRRHAAENAVDLSAATEADEPTTIAVAPHGRGQTWGWGANGTSGDGGDGTRGTLYLYGTANWQWSSEELSWIPDTTTVLHIGSLCCTGPSAARVLRRAARLRQRGALVCMDLSVRPEVMDSPGRGRLLIERPVRSADVIRASAEDIGWLYPGRAPEAVAGHWLRLGTGLVVITGGGGAMAVRGPGSVVHRRAQAAKVIDTAGAADAFTAVLLGALHRLGDAGETVAALSVRELGDVLEAAGVAAGMTCERAGADLPTAAELVSRLRPRSSPGNADSPHSWNVNKPGEIFMVR